MNFDYSPEMIKDLQAFAKFCQERIAPQAMELDRAPFAQAVPLLRENIKNLAALGVLGQQAPTALGGNARPLAEAVAFHEELARACPATFLSVGASIDSCGAAILGFGTDAQRLRFVPPLLKAEKIGCLGLTEPESGSDWDAIQTRAESIGGEWVVNGAKTMVTNAPICDLAVILAKIVREGQEHGSGLFLVERNAPGFTTGAPQEKMGYRGSPTGELFFHDCRIPADSLIGEIGQGKNLTAKMQIASRIASAAGAVGLARACFDEALRHAHRRKVSGHKIISYQEIGFKLADMKMLIDTAVFLVRRAAWLVDIKDAEADPVGRCAKVFATEAATKISSWAVQVFGGYGYLGGFPVERLYRDARLGEIVEGTNEIQRATIAKDCLTRWA